MEISLSIIGTYGEGGDSKILSTKHFDAMYLIAEELVTQINDSGYSLTHLVGGGSVWTSHLSIKLFLNKKVSNLRLFLSAEFQDGTYKDNGIINDLLKNPGGVANYYHHQFQRTTGINSLSEIELAKRYGAELILVDNYYARNALIAKSDFILACTFGNKNEVKEGNTADIIRAYLNRVSKEGIFDKSFHYDLESGEIFIGCTVPIKTQDQIYIKKPMTSSKSNLALFNLFKKTIGTP